MIKVVLYSILMALSGGSQSSSGDMHLNIESGKVESHKIVLVKGTKLNLKGLVGSNLPTTFRLLLNGSTHSEVEAKGDFSLVLSTQNISVGEHKVEVVFKKSGQYVAYWSGTVNVVTSIPISFGDPHVNASGQIEFGLEASVAKAYKTIRFVAHDGSWVEAAIREKTTLPEGSLMPGACHLKGELVQPDGVKHPIEIDFAIRPFVGIETPLVNSLTVDRSVFKTGFMTTANGDFSNVSTSVAVQNDGVLLSAKATMTGKSVNIPALVFKKGRQVIRLVFSASGGAKYYSNPIEMVVSIDPLVEGDLFLSSIRGFLEGDINPLLAQCASAAGRLDAASLQSLQDKGFIVARQGDWAAVALRGNSVAKQASVFVPSVPDAYSTDMKEVAVQVEEIARSAHSIALSMSLSQGDNEVVRMAKSLDVLLKMAQSVEFARRSVESTRDSATQIGKWYSTNKQLAGENSPALLLNCIEAIRSGWDGISERVRFLNLAHELAREEVRVASDGTLSAIERRLLRGSTTTFDPIFRRALQILKERNKELDELTELLKQRDALVALMQRHREQQTETNSRKVRDLERKIDAKLLKLEAFSIDAWNQIVRAGRVTGTDVSGIRELVVAERQKR